MPSLNDLQSGALGPSTANILTGSLNSATSPSSGTLITIPAFRTWMGTVSIDASLTATAVTTAAATSFPLVATQTGAVPSGAQLCGVSLAIPPSTANSGSGCVLHGTNTIPNVVITAGATDSTVIMLTSGSANPSSYWAACIGRLV